jgi:hypothetical protein
MVSNVFLSRINLNLRKIFNRLYAFSAIKSIWVWWVPSFEIFSLRCLWLWTSAIGVLFIKMSGWCGLLIFREIVMVSVFCGLNETNQFVDQIWILSRSLFRMSAVVCGLSMIKYKLVSSANNLIVDRMGKYKLTTRIYKVHKTKKNETKTHKQIQIT